MRVLPIVLAVLLGACAARDASFTMSAPPQSSGDWRIEHRVDRISGEPSPMAIVWTRAGNSKLNHHPPAALQLMCFDKQPIVRVGFDFRVGANRNSTVGYRFDDKPGHDVEATFLQDFRAIVIDDNAEVAQFMDELASSNMLLVRVISLFAGRSTAEFRVNGAAPAIETVLAACPLASPRKGNRSS